MLKQHLNTLSAKRNQVFAMLGLSVYSGLASAVDDPTEALSSFLKSVSDFMSGPFATAAVTISIVAAAMLYAFSPKTELMAWVTRIVIAGSIALSSAKLMTYLQGLFS